MWSKFIMPPHSRNITRLERNRTVSFSMLITPWDSFVTTCVLGRVLENSVSRRDTDRQFPKFDLKPNKMKHLKRGGHLKEDSWNS